LLIFLAGTFLMVGSHWLNDFGLSENLSIALFWVGIILILFTFQYIVQALFDPVAKYFWQFSIVKWILTALLLGVTVYAVYDGWISYQNYSTRTR